MSSFGRCFQSVPWRGSFRRSGERRSRKIGHGSPHQQVSLPITDCACQCYTKRRLSTHRGSSSNSIPAADVSSDVKRLRSRPLSLGYVAGLQSHSTTATTTKSGSHNEDEEDVPVAWNSFDEAYEILEQIDPEVLYEFEGNLWDENRMKFIHSTRDISVIDMEISGEDKAIRSLIINARPKLIQSTIGINHVGATGPKVLGAPPPLVGLTATHLGGLALAVPLWLASSNDKTLLSIGGATPRPQAVVIGAGGCTIPAVLAKAGCNVTAIEPHPDICEAAKRYFGSEDAGVKLIAGYGEEYLSQETTTAIDLMIIDAEDGVSAPPQSMQEEAFWKEMVLPRLSPGAVVAVNVIAEQNERIELRHIMDKIFQVHHVWCCEVPAVANVSDRHCIMFATPKANEEDVEVMQRFQQELGKFEYVDKTEEWMHELEQARTF